MEKVSKKILFILQRVPQESLTIRSIRIIHVVIEILLIVIAHFYSRYNLWSFYCPRLLVKASNL